MTPEQLKSSILQRAMQGKLVPQDPNDEPASELLKKVKKEKEKLIKEGKIKPDKNETEIFRSDDGLYYEKFKDGMIKKVEVPFEIPSSWEWSTLGFVGNWASGATPTKSNSKFFVGGSIPWLLTGDLNDDYITNINGRITDLALAKTSVKLNPSGSVLLAMYGATIGRVGILTFPATTNQACCACNILFDLNNRYLFYFLMSQRKAFAKRAEGGAQPNISKEKIVKTLIPIPPISEQLRIVEHIDDALVKLKGYTELFNKLEKLNKEFPEKLRKSILQYAMQGKLVPQDPNDEPVEVLLEKIRAEKKKLYKEGKIKKKDLEESIIYKGDDNSYYEKNRKSDSLIEDFISCTVETWSYKRLNDIVTISTGLSYRKEDLNLDNSGIRIVRGGNIAPMNFKLLHNDYFINERYINSQNIYLKKNQLLTPVSTSLDHVGKITRLKQDYPNTVAGGFIFQFTPFIDSDVFSQYLEYYLSSPVFYNQIKEITNLSGQALYNVPKTKLIQLFVAIPPQNELLSIIEKVEQVYHLIDQL